MSIDEQKIARINELYRRSKAEGLTDAEKQEQKLLRLEICAGHPRESQKPAE